MRRSLLVTICLAVSGTCQAQNLLINGDLESTLADVYFDGFDPSVADDVPGWNLFLGAADGSYVLVNGAGSGNVDVDMAIGPAGGGLETAAGARPTITTGALYKASVTYDNYFNPAFASYFIDWYDGAGMLISSDGGILADPNGPFGYDPYNQSLAVTATAPKNAANAGVRFTSSLGYNGLAADNFSFRQIPEPSVVALLLCAGVSLFGCRVSP